MKEAIYMPELKFEIGYKITEIDERDRVEYTIYDISYSYSSDEWYYEYSYWKNGFEHYCKSPISYADSIFERIK